MEWRWLTIPLFVVPKTVDNHRRFISISDRFILNEWWKRGTSIRFVFFQMQIEYIVLLLFQEVIVLHLMKTCCHCLCHTRWSRLVLRILGSISSVPVESVHGVWYMWFWLSPPSSPFYSIVIKYHNPINSAWILFYCASRTTSQCNISITTISQFPNINLHKQEEHDRLIQVKGG